MQYCLDLDSRIYNADQGTRKDVLDQAGQCGRVVLGKQLLWLIRLRWIAVVVTVTAALADSYVFRFWSARVWAMLQVEAKAGAGVTVNVNLPMGRAGEVGRPGGGAAREERQKVLEA